MPYVSTIWTNTGGVIATNLNCAIMAKVLHNWKFDSSKLFTKVLANEFLNEK